MGEIGEGSIWRSGGQVAVPLALLVKAMENKS
jgi:hypothetical protein